MTADRDTLRKRLEDIEKSTGEITGFDYEIHPRDDSDADGPRVTMTVVP